MKRNQSDLQKHCCVMSTRNNNEISLCHSFSSRSHCYYLRLLFACKRNDQWHCVGMHITLVFLGSLLYGWFAWNVKMTWFLHTIERFTQSPSSFAVQMFSCLGKRRENRGENLLVKKGLYLFGINWMRRNSFSFGCDVFFHPSSMRPNKFESTGIFVVGLRVCVHTRIEDAHPQEKGKVERR